MGNEKKAQQLGMPIGTATAKLRKAILFQLLVEFGKNVCYQCKIQIRSVDDLSIEHKRPWLDSNDPIATFFDLNNIAFSHLSCNIGAARKSEAPHGTHKKYCVQACRCDRCKEWHKNDMRKWRARTQQRNNGGPGHE